MSRGSRFLLIGAALVVLVAAIIVFFPRQSLPTDLLTATPKDATALIHVRVAHLLKSKAFDQLISQRGHDRGMKEVKKLCGFNPLERVDEALIFAVPPEEGGLPAWGALLRGDLDPRELSQCVKRTLQKEGHTAKLKQEDVDDIPCVVSSSGTSRVCAVSDGLIGGSDDVVRAAIATLLEKAPSVRENQEIASLWDTLDASADARAVAQVPAKMRALLTTFARPFLPASLAPITRVEGGAGELWAGSTLRGQLSLDTPDDDDARALAAATEGILKRAVDVPGLALTPAGALIEHTRVKAESKRVLISGDYPLAAIGTLIDLLPAARHALMPSDAPASQAPRAPMGTSQLGPKKPEPGATP